MRRIFLINGVFTSTTVSQSTYVTGSIPKHYVRCVTIEKYVFDLEKLICTSKSDPGRCRASNWNPRKSTPHIYIYIFKSHHNFGVVSYADKCSQFNPCPIQSHTLCIPRSECVKIMYFNHWSVPSPVAG